MKKNTSLYYLVLLGVALAVPWVIQKTSHPAEKPKAASTRQHGETASVSPGAPGIVPAVQKPTAAAPIGPEQIATLDTPEFSARISSLTGGVKSFTLKDAQFEKAGKPHDVVSTDKAAYYPLVFRLNEHTGSGNVPVIGDYAAWEMQTLSPQAVRLHAVANDIAIERKLEAGAGPYQVWVTTTLQNRGESPRKLTLDDRTFHYVAHAAESGGVPLLPARSSAISGGLCSHDKDLEREDRKKLEKAPLEWHGGVRFTGIENVYFLNALVAVDKTAAACLLESSQRGRDRKGEAIGSLFSATLRHAEVNLKPQEKTTLRTLAYLGPKTPEELSRVGHSLRTAINTGFFTSLADGLTALLALIHGVVGNWGIAIILLTFFVKLTLFPLTHKQMASMAKMKELKPDIDRINAAYADDREKKGAAVMELYRKSGVNPMAGCFPALLQVPIWFSLYSSLSSNIRLLHAPFALWWSDLSSPDPYFVLPLALGVLMFVQQKLTPPTGADPLQAKMMLYMMPTMITSFMLFLPAGLCLYMFTNSALSILQQRVIESRLKPNAPVSSTVSSSSSLPMVAASAEPGLKDKTSQRRLRRGRK